MAKFNYTHADWNKARPKLMASTGLGDVLKDYEKKKGLVLRGANPWAVCYRDALVALSKVELKRLEALKICETKKEKSAAEYLKAADAKAEKGQLARAIGHRLINLLGSFQRAVDEVAERYTARINTATRAVDAYEKGTVNGEIQKEAESLAINDGSDAMPTFKGKDELEAAINPANGLNKDEALAPVVANCKKFKEKVVAVGEQRKNSEVLIRKLKLLVQGNQKKLIEKAEKQGVW